MINKDGLEKFRFQGDSLADDFVQRILKDKSGEVKSRFNQIATNADLEQFAEHFDSAGSLIDNIRLPEWADQKKIELARKIFNTHSSSILAILGLYSLPYCYAAANGARVLIQSRKILENPEKRLAETGQFVLEIFEDDAFESTGKGYAAIFKVRLMHAFARYYASKHIKDETPVNQEDMTGTNLSFSLICIRGLQKLGIDLNEKERQAYIHFWNVISAMLGINRDLLPESFNEVSHLERLIRKRQFRKSSEGVRLTNSLLNLLNSQKPAQVRIDMGEVMGYFLGKEVSDYLEVPNGNPAVSSLLSFLKAANYIASISRTNHRKTIEQIRTQVRDSNGTFFTV